MDDAGVEEDLMFHLRITEASKNSVLKSLSMIVFPDMVKYSQSLNICGDGRFRQALVEHEEILHYIQKRNADKATAAMQAHLKDMLEKAPGRNSFSASGD